jgi:hypothetical protein
VGWREARATTRNSAHNGAKSVRGREASQESWDTEIGRARLHSNHGRNMVRCPITSLLPLRIHPTLVLPAPFRIHTHTHMPSAPLPTLHTCCRVAVSAMAAVMVPQMKAPLDNTVTRSYLSRGRAARDGEAGREASRGRRGGGGERGWSRRHGLHQVDKSVNGDRP